MINILKLRKMQKGEQILKDDDKNKHEAEKSKNSQSKNKDEKKDYKVVENAPVDKETTIEDNISESENRQEFYNNEEAAEENTVDSVDNDELPLAINKEISEAASKISENIGSIGIHQDEVKKTEKIIQLVGFYLGEGYYGVDIMKVREINRMVGITKVPRAPKFIEGVINLRGSVLPVVNLRAKINMDRREHDKLTRIIVVDINGIMVGFIVDSVNEVIRIPEELTQAPPDIISSDMESRFIKSIAKIDENLLIILDIEKILSIEEQSAIRKTKY